MSLWERARLYELCEGEEVKGARQIDNNLFLVDVYLKGIGEHVTAMITSIDVDGVEYIHCSFFEGIDIHKGDKKEVMKRLNTRVWLDGQTIELNEWIKRRREG